MAFATTIVAAVANLYAKLDDVVGGTVGGSRPTYRAFLKSEGSPFEAPIPFLAAKVLTTKAGGSLDGKIQWKVQLKLRILFHITAYGEGDNDALYYQALAENMLQGWTRLDGVEGGENPEWSYSLGNNEPGNVGTCESLRGFLVTVTSGSN